MRKQFSFSLWLVPEKTVFKRLEKITEMLRKKFGSPKIRPHVTLLGGFSSNLEDAVYGTEKVAQKLKTFKVQLKGIDHTGEFFRSLFLVAEKSEGLVKAHQVASSAFGKPQRDFMPHLSLFYGKLSEETKEQIIKELGKKYSASFAASKIHLVVNNERDMSWPEIAAFPFNPQKT